MTTFLAVTLGGAIGAGTRYALTGWAGRMTNGGMPVGTLLVNVLGCLLIGLLVPWLLEGRLVRPELRAFLMIGVLGGFTTFSTYAYEAVDLVNQGAWGRAGFVVLLNNVLGLSLVLVGWRLALWLQRGS